MGLVALVGPERHAEDEPVQWDDVVLPNEVVHSLDALVHVPGAAALAELDNEDVAEAPQVRRQLLGCYAAQNLEKKISNYLKV